VYFTLFGACRPQVSSALFFSYNMALGPPYRVIVDTNFINFSIQNKVGPSN
jgi:U3 small nucleolar RNA-associated protein 24